MVAENCNIKVPGVMKNHTLSVHVLDVLKMTEAYDKCMTSLMLLFPITLLWKVLSADLSP